jgi:hypothetical protein
MTVNGEDATLMFRLGGGIHGLGRAIICAIELYHESNN